MNQRDKDILLLSSYVMSMVGFAIAFNIFMSETNWWFWSETDGAVGLPIVFVSLPLIIISGIVRLKLIGFAIKSLVDLICCFLILCLFLLPVHKFYIYLAIILTTVSLYFLFCKNYLLIKTWLATDKKTRSH